VGSDNGGGAYTCTWEVTWDAVVEDSDDDNGDNGVSTKLQANTINEENGGGIIMFLMKRIMIVTRGVIMSFAIVQLIYFIK